MSDRNHFKYDVFIAYHGTYDDNGSAQKANDIYEHLTENGLKCYYYPKTSNNVFADTPKIVCECRKFLLVANKTLFTHSDSIGNGLQKELEAVYRSMYNNDIQQGDARIYAYDALTMDMIDKNTRKNHAFFLVFNGVAHFLEENGIDRMNSDLVAWVKSRKDYTDREDPDPEPQPMKNSVNSWCMHQVSIEKTNGANPLYEPFFQLFIRSVSDDSDISGKNLSQIADELAISVEKREKYILKITGKRGTGKKQFLEWLYLYFSSKEQSSLGFIPFYISMESLYMDYYNSGMKGGNHFVQKVLSPVINSLPKEKIPLFIISGIAESVIKDPLERHIKDLLEKLLGDNFALIIDIDSCLVSQRIRQRPSVIFGNHHYHMHLCMEAISKYDIDKCHEAIRSYVALPDSFAEGNAIEESFKRIGFYYLDYFVLRLIDDDDGASRNLNEIMQRFCYDLYFDGKSDDFKKRASKFAFEYAYRSMPVTDLEKDDLRVISFFRHSIIIDYLIACHYVDQLSSLKLDDEDLLFFEQILPKESTRFIVPMINDDEALEVKIVDFVQARYDDMKHCCKSEMHYFLGRLQNPRSKGDAKRFLQDKYSEQRAILKHIRNVDPDDFNERITLFLYRSIAVSLTYCDDNTAAEEYVENMITSKAANEINKGFHLEYYGDKSFMPTIDTLDFKDEVSVGHKTISVLIGLLRNAIFELTDTKNEKSFKPSSKISLFTLCSIIQSRMHTKSFDQLKLKDYARTCINFINDFRRYRLLPNSGIVASYYNMVYNDFNDFISNKSTTNKVNMLCNMITKIGSLSDCPRSGWLRYYINQPESVAEHMYNCWIIGLLCLPEQYKANEKYDKETILKLLLVHDWAESVTGDIAKIKKTADDKQNESRIMKMLLLKGTYPEIADLDDLYDLWSDYESERFRSFNSRIVKDIDCIQALFRFCRYYLTYRDHFRLESPEEWFRSYRKDITTPIGMDIYKKILINNPEFSSVVEILPDELKT